MPVGTILFYSGNLASLTGSTYRWLLCDGSEISRTTYGDLFNVVGVTYGSGNGKDTFNLPDFRVRFPLGSTGSNDPLATGGASSHVLTAAEMPAHSHGVGPLTTSMSGTHTHSINDAGHTHGSTDGPGGFGVTTSYYSAYALNFNPGGFHAHTILAASTGITINNVPDHTHTLTGSTDVQGTSQAISLMPPYQTIHYIIRA